MIPLAQTLFSKFFRQRIEEKLKVRSGGNRGMETIDKVLDQGVRISGQFSSRDHIVKRWD